MNNLFLGPIIFTLTLRLSDEIFANSFLTNGILEFRSEALFFSILSYASNDN